MTRFTFHVAGVTAIQKQVGTISVDCPEKKINIRNATHSVYHCNLPQTTAIVLSGAQPEA